MHQPTLIKELKDNWATHRMAWFTHGFYGLREVKGQVLLADLRMGQEPTYTFQFSLAQREGSARAARGQRLEVDQAASYRQPW